jgi:glycosyltransferase involved in cell wall biosynthesis
MSKQYDIIFPFYKDFKYLKNCLSNVNKQTIHPKNLIFIDDGNNQISLKSIVRKNLHKKIKLIFITNRINQGPEKNIEIAIKHIRSKFFFLISADDIIYENFAEENINKLSFYPDAPYIFSNIIINNSLNKKKYIIKYYFLKKNYFDRFEVANIFKNYQFKIYHNTVVFNSNIFKKNNIFKKKYGKRVDMLNLLYLAFKSGFSYHNKNLSEFTIRENQWGKKLSDLYLIKELLKLKKYKNKFYNFFINCNLHFDLSVFSIPSLIKKKLSEVITISWLVRSMKFFIWKKIRFMIPNKILELLFKIFN